MSGDVASNVLGTIGTVLWCIQLIPQIWYNWRRKQTEGLPPLMMFLWAACMLSTKLAGLKTCLLTDWVSRRGSDGGVYDITGKVHWAEHPRRDVCCTVLSSELRLIDVVSRMSIYRFRYSRRYSDSSRLLVGVRRCIITSKLWSLAICLARPL